MQSQGAKVADLQDRWLAADLHGDRHAAVRRPRRPQGIPPDRRPPGHDRPGRLRLRLHRQRPVRAVRRGLRADLPQRERTSTRRSRCSRRPATRARRSTCTPPTAPSGMVDTGHRVRHPGEGRRRHGQRQERSQLLRRRLPQAGLLDRLLGHARLPQPGAAGLAPDLAVQRDPLAANVRRWLRLRRASTRRAQRRPTRQAQRDHAPDAAVEYDFGGYIIPYFGALIDGLRQHACRDSSPSKGTLNLDTFGHGFRTIWFA